MKGSEVIKALEEGKSIKAVDWEEGQYIYLDKSNRIIDEEGEEYMIFHLFEDRWKVYDSRKELPKEFEWLKAFSVNRCAFNEAGKCNKCPMSEQTQVTQWSICKTISEIAKELNKEYKID